MTGHCTVSNTLRHPHSFTPEVQAPILSEFQQWFQVDTNSFQAERVSLTTFSTH